LKKTFLMILIVIILITTATTQSLNIKEYNTGLKKTEIIFIDSNNTIGPWDGSYDNPYQTITEGVNNAESGDIIYVLKGIYTEQIIIDETIHIIGENKEETIINSDYKEYGVKIIAENVKLEGLTIKNSGGFKENSAIKIKANNTKISDCMIKRAKTGIYLNNTNKNTIDNCTVYLCGKGIYAKQSKNFEIKNTEICNCGIGLNLIDSHNIKIKNTYIHESGYAIFSDYSSNISFEKCAICDNNDNGGGCGIFNSNDINFNNCNILHNGFGFRIKNSKKINIEYCNVQNNTHFGIWMQENSEEIKISDCELTNNFRHCIYMTDSKCIIQESNLYNNWIESVNVEDSLCIARNNYWGGSLGPVFNKGFRLVDIIKPHFRKIKYFPWSVNQYQNIGSDWKVEETFTKTIVNGYEDDQIKIPGNDTDNDGIPNWWEEEFNYDPLSWNDHKNLDPDKDGLSNFEECIAYEWGADPFYKDIFLEIDWTESKTEGATNRPSDELVDEIKEKFLERNISLHIDLGTLGGSEIVPYVTDITVDGLVDLYWDYFIHNDLNNPRKNIFHYGFICDKGPGNGFAVIGWGHLNAFCISADVISASFPRIPREKLITHASIHELGHTMGLVVDDFGGNDNHAAIYPQYSDFWKYRNYKSIMNYRYTYQILDFSDGNNGRVDYDDWAGMEFDFFKNTHFEWPKN